MNRLRILTLVFLMLAVLTFTVKNRKSSTLPAGNGLLIDKTLLTVNPNPQTPEIDRRPGDQTFLTYPEWFLVFSPAEQADYFKTHTSTSFPYNEHIDQMWRGYQIVYDQIKNNYPFNTGYHMMIMVIAGSTTIEYGIKLFYETVIGRITDTSPEEKMTAEDKFNADYQYSYVKFIEALPWYEFDFSQMLNSLWVNTPITGPHLLRKLERRYYLTTELIVKVAYGWLIGLGTKTAYETASLKTAVVMHPPRTGQETGMNGLQILNDGKILVMLPRYAEFNLAVCKLAKHGYSFNEIAGNKGAIMLTVLTTKPFQENNGYMPIFSQEIITKPGLKRIALVTTVRNLSNILQMLQHEKVTIEHIYDY